MKEVLIPYGEKKIPLKVPEKNLAVVFDPPFPPPPRDLAGEILQALDAPVAGLPFSERIASAGFCFKSQSTRSPAAKPAAHKIATTKNIPLAKTFPLISGSLL